jgi:hypothetical protein
VIKRACCSQTLVVAVLALGLILPVEASSHREAPFVTEHPKVDGTDLYVFRSYESGREGFVTILANYLPLQDAYGGPNYFDLDPAASYRIHIENNGDGVEDINFLFNIEPTLKELAIPVDGTPVPVPLKNIGQILPGSDPAADGGLNVFASYTVRILRGRQDSLSDLASRGEFLTNIDDGSQYFFEPVDNFGQKSIPDYSSYVQDFVYDVAIPGCGTGRVFVGQRQEGFAVNLGEIFDLVNTDPLGDPDGEGSATADKNVTSLALEVPIACLTEGNGDVIGAWTTAWLPKFRGLRDQPTFSRPAHHGRRMTQVSRLGMPLVNEVVIGLPDKDRFNASRPADDLQFATYVTNPSLPEILEILFPVEAPNNFPRGDLLATFVTGIAGLNELGFGEMQRLNTAIAPTSSGSQSNLGVMGGDAAGFPNGRRPGDDVVDIELRVAMGLLCHAGLGLCDPGDAPSGTLPFTDGTLVEETQFDAAFPYLKDPIPGSPNSVNGVGE